MFRAPGPDGQSSMENAATSSDHPPPHNALTIARETLKQLAARRIAPTPENYRTLYLEISGDEAAEHLQRHHAALRGLAGRLRAQCGLPVVADAVEAALDEKSWQASSQALLVLANHAAHPPAAAPTLISAPIVAPAPAATAHECTPLRALLASLLESPIVEHFCAPLNAFDEARVLSGRVRAANPETDEKVIAAIRQFLARVEAQVEDSAELRNGFLRLLRLLVDNVAQLVPDDRWIEGQIAMLRELLATPASLYMLREAETRLREVLSRQSSLRTSLREAKTALKSMVETLIEQLGSLSDDTGEYQHRIEDYSTRIQTVEDIAGLGTLLDELLADTRHMQEVTNRSRADLIASRERAEEAERRVVELESQLADVSTQMREDQLTGTLNRRGFDDAFVRETARAQRYEMPLAVALLDIDNFKQLNDNFGHRAGDSALQHLVKVIRDTLRPSDVVCRFGGEEFLLLLPDTNTADATSIMVRLQRELTRRFFLHNNEQVLITFSAGVTHWQTPESNEAVTARADRALYEAKKSGKNRVCVAG